MPPGPEIMRLTGGPEFEVADGVLVILAGIVNIGAMSLEDEAFFKTTTLIFAVGCFTLCIPGVRPASFGATRGLPLMSTMRCGKGGLEEDQFAHEN